MSSFNLCVLAGNIVKDPELTYLPSGVAKTFFTLAVDNPRAQTRAQKGETLFMPVVFFGKLADIVMKYCKKGSSVLVSGRLNQFTFTKSDKDKTKHISLLANDVQFLGGKLSKTESVDWGEQAAAVQQEAPLSSPSENTSENTSENIPF